MRRAAAQTARHLTQRLAILASAMLLTAALTGRASAQELPPPPPPPPPAQILPSIAIPSPTDPLCAPARVVSDPAPSTNPFWPVLPPPAGPPLAATPPLLVDFWTIGQHHLSHSDSQ